MTSEPLRRPAERLFAHDHVTRVRAEIGRWTLGNLRELWAYRELLWVLTRRDVQVRYRQTILGIGWAVVRPVMSMIVFSLVFGRFAGMPSNGYPYPVFVFAGLLPWTFFAGAVSSSGASLVGSAGLVGKVYFPRLLLPLASIGAGFVDLLLASTVLLGMVAYFGLPFSWSLLAAPILLFLLALTAVAVGILVAALSVTYRDAQHLLPYGLQVWMFLTPVIYPVSLFPERWRWVLLLNPVTGLVEGFRTVFLGQPLALLPVAVSVAVVLPLLVVALVVFRRSERRFADLL